MRWKGGRGGKKNRLEGGKERPELKLVYSSVDLRFVDGTKGAGSDFLEKSVLLIRVRAHLWQWFQEEEKTG
jgi:hypothetical protein